MTAEPAPVDAAALRDAVAASAWRRIDVVAETGSTNADLIERAEAGEDIAGAVLIAEHQTAGRGRNGRTWSAVPRAQLTISAAVPVAGVAVASWGWIPLLAGLAVVGAVAAVTGVRTGLKWPNDVLAGPREGKLAGILAEVASPASVIVVGVGLNVTVRRSELPTAEATSLGLLGATALDRTELAATFLQRLAEGIATLAADGVDDALVQRYTAASLTIGSVVRATLPGEREVIGTATGVDEQGRLQIVTASDATVTVSAGDILHLRPFSAHAGR